MKFDMGKAWADAVGLLSANREVMLAMGGVFAFLPSAAMSVLVPQTTPPPGADPAQLLAFVTETYQANIVWILLLSLFQTVGVLALLAVLSDRSKPTVSDALKSGLVGVLPYIGTYVLVGLAIGLVGAVLIGIPIKAELPVALALTIPLVGVGMAYLMIKLCMVSPIIAIEKIYNPVRVMSRSWQLTKGNSLRLFGFFVLLLLAYFVIALVVGIVIAVPVALLGAGTVGLLLNAILSAIVSAIATIAGAAIIAAIHRQLAGPSTSAISETFE